MKPLSHSLAHRSAATFAALVLSRVLFATAGLPEPDTVFYGTVALDNAYVTAADVDVSIELRRTPAGPPIAAYRMGENSNLADRYSVRARVESGPPLDDPEASAIGDTVWVVVTKAGQVRHQASHLIDGRGQFVALNFGDLDSDGDGMPDGFEQSYFGSSTGGSPTADPDGDYRNNLQEALDKTDPLTADGQHPADRTPADWLMTLGEVTSYASSWLRGEPWPTGPQPADTVLVDFVTSAGKLWLGGERYIFDNIPATTPPNWWTNPPPAPALASTQSATEPSNPSPRRALAGPVAEEDPEVVVRSAGAAVIPGVPVTITLTVTPPESVRVYAVEERLPQGWTVRDVSAKGSADASLGRVRWGPFFDHTPRTFTYLATPPATLAGAFQGVASLDGRSITAVGLTDIGTPPLAGALTLRFLQGIAPFIEVSGPPGMAFSVESSTDLIRWSVTQRGHTDADGRAQVSPPQSLAPIFFRALRTPTQP